MTRHSRALSVPWMDAAALAGDALFASGAAAHPAYRGTPETTPAVAIIARHARLTLIDTRTRADAGEAPPAMEDGTSASRMRRAALIALRERWSAKLLGALVLSIVAPWIAVFALHHTLNGGSGRLVVAAALASGIAVLLVRDARATRVHRRLENEYSQFFALSPDPLCVLTLDGRFARINSAWGALLGQANDALIGASWFAFVHPQDAPALHLAWSRLVETRANTSLEVRSRAAHGDELWLQWHLAVSESQGVVFAVARDVTRRRRQEEELRALKDAAEAASRELESFSYSVSHDLRRPLRAIEGFGTALAEEYGARLDDTGLDYVARIRRNTRHASELIDDLLTLAQLARCDLREEDIDLTAAAHEILDDLRRADPARVVETEIAAGITARGDRRLLRIVLDNLLGNAWKFSRERTPAHITVARAETARGIAYCVRDNGAGFDMAYADKLFGAFQRLHREEQFEGSGVGLATVQRVIRRHGGDVWAEGAVGLGATVYFRLPERGVAA